jgi:phosphoribosyl-AMP cyclohydrolase
MNLKYNSDGLIPAIVQCARSRRVLMMAWMNETSLQSTLQTGLMHYWSRSRKKFWLKGETSGHTQKVVRWAVDCDADTLLFEVDQTYSPEGAEIPVSEYRVFDPASTYSA